MNILESSKNSTPPIQRKWGFRIGKWWLYISHNGPMKFRKRYNQPRQKSKLVDMKRKLVKQRGQVCELCGCHIERYCKTNIHHVIPWTRYPEGELDERNIMVVCQKCHSEIHNNPLLDASLIRKKSLQLGVDIKKIYGAPIYDTNN